MAIVSRFLYFVCVGFESRTKQVVLIFVGTFGVEGRYGLLDVGDLYGNAYHVVHVGVVDDRLVIVACQRGSQRRVFLRGVLRGLQLGLYGFAGGSSISTLYLFLTTFRRAAIFATSAGDVCAGEFRRNGRFLIRLHGGRLYSLRDVFVYCAGAVGGFQLRACLTGPTTSFLAATVGSSQFRAGRFRGGGILSRVLLRFVVRRNTSTMLCGCSFAVGSLGVEGYLSRRLHLIRVFLVGRCSLLFPIGI